MTHTILQLAFPDEGTLTQYQGLAEKLEYPPLRGSDDGFILVTDVAGVLVGAVTVYKTGGPYVYFEDFLLNPEFPVKVRHLAGELIAEQIIYMCNASGKIPMCPLTFQGGVNILQRYGFTGHPVHMMTRDPQPMPVGESELVDGVGASQVSDVVTPDEPPKFTQKTMKRRVE